MENRLTRRNFITKAALGTAAIAGASYLNSFAANVLPTKRNVYIFSKHLQWLDYAAMAKAVKEYGFDGVDLTVRPNGHVLPENAENDLPKAVEAIRKEGLIIDTITTAITGVDEPNTLKIVETAHKLGIKQYRLGWFEYDKNLDIPKNLDIIKSKFIEISKLNKQYNIRADYQNHSGTGFGASLWDIYEVFKNIDTEWLGVRFDVRHATVESAYSWATDLKLIKQYIRSLDIKDFVWDYNNDKKTNVLRNTPLGKGTVNFELYFKLINEHNLDYNITMHMEYELGGAEHGEREIKISKQEFNNAITSDLGFIKKYNK